MKELYPNVQFLTFLTQPREPPFALLGQAEYSAAKAAKAEDPLVLRSMASDSILLAWSGLTRM